MHTVQIIIDGREFVALLKADYLKLTGRTARRLGKRLPKGAVDAIEYTRSSIARALRGAREHAGLTQTALARKLRKSQSMVSGAESGHVSVGERYVAAVLKACGLPPDWKGAPTTTPRSA
jgi:ribosome-binding protein aMBF1 (putative translation factor)